MRFSKRVELPVGLVALGFLAIALALMPRPAVLTDTAPQAGGSYAKAPLAFIPNRGQTAGSVRYYAEGAGFGFFFTDDRAVLSMQGKQHDQALQLRFLGANPSATPAPQHQARGKVNYLRGDDPSRWQTGLPTYRQLTYQGLWPGVDMSFRGAGGKLKYEFRVKPGANAGRIRLAYAGAQGLSVGGNGSLLIHTRSGTLRDSAPRAWQEIGGRRVPVESSYVVPRSGGKAHPYGFELGAYDPSRPLVIDPGIIYSTYLGGSSVDSGEAITVDGEGNAYVTGRADSSNFPTTVGAYDGTHSGSSDAFVTKLNHDGTDLEYSTYLGGSGIEIGNGIAIDSGGDAYVTGYTDSSDFPTTAGALDTGLDGNEDGFVAKLSADGSALSYSTYLGGSDNLDAGNDIAVDSTGSAYVTGDTISTDFPTTPGAFDTVGNQFTIYQAFVSKLDPTGSSLDYSTYLDGSGTFDLGYGIAVDSSGYAYVTGSTSSGNFPTTMGAFDTTQNGGDDAFVTKLDPTGASLAYSTFLGGADLDGASDIAIDGSGNAYVAGGADSDDFPTTAGAFDTSYNDDGDAFVTKLNPSGTALGYSTYLGGTGAATTGQDYAGGIAVDGVGRAYVTGRTGSAAFPTTPDAADKVLGPLGDAFFTKFNATGSGLVYSTYLGGAAGSTGGSEQGNAIVLDGGGDAYITGYTTSSDFPATGGSFDTTSNGNQDAFVTKIGANGYARPVSATPVAIHLVTAFKPCSTPNSVHSPSGGLTGASCNPPVPQSDFLTVGTIDVNGQKPNFTGLLIYQVLGESPINTGNGDQADVRLTFNMTDVRNAGDLTDYTGEVRVSTILRITDRYNGPTLNDPATLTDLPLEFTAPCASTPDQATGGTCSVVTTADSVTADMVREGKRAVWELGPTQVYDGGADGDVETADNTLFAVQGLFAP
jgi:beta-propeller repeat-containing protein